MRIVNEKEFNEIIEKGVTLVDFYADWCGPCKMLSPILEKLAPQYEGKVNFIKVNVDNEMNLAVKYGISSIPNLILFKDNRPVDQLIGLQPEANLIRFIESGL